MTDREEQMRQQQEMQLHSQNMSGPQVEDDNDAGEMLRRLSEDVGVDLPEELVDDEILGQQVARVTSTANLSEKDVKSNKWVWEISLLLYMSQYPKETGLHGHWRGFAHGDTAEAKEPLNARKKAAAQSFMSSSQLALSRSEGFTAVSEAARSISESVVHNDKDNSGGGLLGRLRP